MVKVQINDDNIQDIRFLQRRNLMLNQISWTEKITTLGYSFGFQEIAFAQTIEYDVAVANAKRKWLQRHLPSVDFDEVYFVPYGTPKSTVIPKAKNGVLFDDEEQNLVEWNGLPIHPKFMFDFLKMI